MIMISSCEILDYTTNVMMGRERERGREGGIGEKYKSYTS